MKDKTYIVGFMMLSEFKIEVESFLGETGIAPSRLGREAVRDPSFVSDLRCGAEPREKTRTKVLIWMDSVRKMPTPTDVA